MFSTLIQDFKAVKQNDPAARNLIETLLCHTPLHAIWIYRLANVLRNWRIPIIPRILSMLGHFWSGVEIHPGATIGHSFFIDHGTGTVIGETSEIGDNCVIFHNVTLGGTGKFAGKRHPTIGNNVLIGTGATLLGPLTVHDNAKVGAGSFLIMRDVPANSTVAGTPARIVKLNNERTDQPLQRTIPTERSIHNGG